MNIPRIEYVLNHKEEQDFEAQVQAVVRLHDMIQESKDPMIKEIAKFMPPIDSRVVLEAIKRLKDRKKETLK